MAASRDLELLPFYWEVFSGNQSPAVPEIPRTWTIEPNSGLDFYLESSVLDPFQPVETCEVAVGEIAPTIPTLTQEPIRIEPNSPAGELATPIPFFPVPYSSLEVVEPVEDIRESTIASSAQPSRSHSIAHAGQRPPLASPLHTLRGSGMSLPAVQATGGPSEQEASDEFITLQGSRKRKMEQQGRNPQSTAAGMQIVFRAGPAPKRRRAVTPLSFDVCLGCWWHKQKVVVKHPICQAHLFNPDNSWL